MSDTIRIGVYVDGTWWYHLTHYWLHHHPMRVRLDLAGVQDAVRHHAHKVYETPLDQVVVDKRYFFQADRGTQNRTWANVLQHRLGYDCHWLPFDHNNDREIGVDVDFAVTCWDTAGNLDLLALITGDDDYHPLVEKLVAESRRVIVPRIRVEYLDGRSGKQRWLFSGDRLRDAATDSPTWEELLNAADGVDGLISPFLRQEPNRRVPTPRAR